MPNSKVQLANGTVLLDLTSDTVSAPTLKTGITAHDKAGNLIIGTMSPPTLQSKTATENGTVTPDSGYDGLSSVTVNVPTGTARSSSDLTVSGATVSVPAGLYSSDASKSVTSGTAGTPTGTKGTVSNYAVTVTPKVTNATGYITGGTKTGTAVTVSASDLGLGTVSSLTKSGGTVSLAKNKYSTSNLSTTVTPSDLGLSTVSALTKSGGTVSIDANKYGTSKLTATVTAADVTSGTALITSTAATDVTNYASAQVSDANLVAENIALGKSILGVLGTFNPTKVEVGTFSAAMETTKTISHTLGQVPDFVLFISQDAASQKASATVYGGWSKKTLQVQPTTFPGQVALKLAAGQPASTSKMTKLTSANLLTSTSSNGAPYKATATQFTVGGNTSTGYLIGSYFWIAMIF